MSPALTRRGLVQAGAAMMGAAVAGIPVSAQALPCTDAFLLDLIARYAVVAAERNAHAPEHDAAERRFKAALPPRPEALTETFSDVLDHLPSTGRDTRPNGRPWCYFTPGDVERLRGAGHVTELMWGEDGEPLPPVLNQRGERRRLAILAAHDAWTGEKQALADRVGLTAAEAEDDRLYAAVWSLRDPVGAEAKSIVHQAVGDASGLTIKGQIRQAARHLGYAADNWRVREAWYGRAGAWNPAALSDLQERFSQWRMEEGARLEVTDQASGLPMLALKVSAIRQSLSDLMLQVTALEASISSLLSEDAQAGDGGSSPDV